MKNMKLLSGHKRIVNTLVLLLLISFYNLCCALPVSKPDGAEKSSRMGQDETKATIPFTETDSFPNSYARIRLILPDASTEYVSLIGPSIWQVFFEGASAGKANDDNGNGLDDVATELTNLNLVGTGSAVGPVILRVNSLWKSIGGIEEMANNTPGTLDVPPFTATGMASSFFDVYAEIEINGQIFHTKQTQRLHKNINHKPPMQGVTYTSLSPTPLILYNESGDPTAMNMIIDSYIPGCGD